MQLPRKRLQRAIWPLLVIVPVMLALVWPSMEVLGASRAYIAALGYWSRAQKDAVVYLLRYAETRDAANYTAFKQVMSIPLGHRVAREAMRENPPNRALARAGFLRGGNAPEDIDKLIWLFVNYHKVPFVAESVRAWDATDEGVEGLLIAGAQLDAMIRTGTATPAAIATIATQVQAINARLDPLQQAFSISLSEGFDRVRWLLFLALSATALLLLLLAWLSARQMIARAVRAEEDLAAAERTVSAERDRALVTLQSIGDAVITANADGRIDYLNPIAEKVTGWSNAEAIGRPLEEVVRIVDEHGGNPVAELPQRILRERGPIEIARNATLVRRDGSEVAIAESASRIRARSGEALGIVIVFRDVSRERRMAAQLSYHASHDLLTGLVNRVEFERRLQTALHTIATEQRSHVLLF
ncbi:MAG TPA: PAS domain S-box protein, partial [Burkholderiales bacterium]